MYANCFLSSWQRCGLWPPGGGEPALQHKILREANCKYSIVPSSGPNLGRGERRGGGQMFSPKKIGVGGVGSKYETYGVTS